MALGSVPRSENQISPLNGARSQSTGCQRTPNPTRQTQAQKERSCHCYEQPSKGDRCVHKIALPPVFPTLISTSTLQTLRSSTGQISSSTSTSHPKKQFIKSFIHASSNSSNETSSNRSYVPATPLSTRIHEHDLMHITALRLGSSRPQIRKILPTRRDA